ncbi:unnamed protein product [Chrysoparadoxa australica]
MKFIVAAALCAVGAQAFVPATPLPSVSAGSSMKMEATLESIGGYGIETMGKPFDPCGLASVLPMDKMREYETVQGRVAMLACVGYVVPHYYMFPNDTITSPDGVTALLQMPPVAWAQIIGLCGIIEANQWRSVVSAIQPESKTTPFWDPARLWPETEKEQEKMKLRELKNGRLAQVAIATYLAHDLLPGTVPDWAVPY